jgi:hypothetical protein
MIWLSIAGAWKRVSVIGLEFTAGGLRSVRIHPSFLWANGFFVDYEQLSALHHTIEEFARDSLPIHSNFINSRRGSSSLARIQVFFFTWVVILVALLVSRNKTRNKESPKKKPQKHLWTWRRRWRTFATRWEDMQQDLMWMERAGEFAFDHL